jgi:cathepsin D
LSHNISDSKRAIETNPLTTTNDMVWSGMVSVGTPAVPFKINFDTGSSAFWVPDITCVTCGYRTFYDKDDSSTSRFLGRPFGVEYGDGCRVTGELYTETVTIAGRTITQQTMGAAMQASNLEGVDDGILGLPFRRVSEFHSTPVFQTLINQNKLDSPVFAIMLQDPGMYSELTLGGLNPDLYTGPVTYARLTEEAQLWEINFDSLNIGGQQVFGRTLCIIDSVRSNYSLLTT